MIFDKSLARKFRETARQIIHPPMPAMFGLPQPANDSGSAPESDADDEGDDIFGDAAYGDTSDFVTIASDADTDYSPRSDFMTVTSDDDRDYSPSITVASDDDRDYGGSAGSDDDGELVWDLDEDEEDPSK